MINGHGKFWRQPRVGYGMSVGQNDQEKSAFINWPVPHPFG